MVGTILDSLVFAVSKFAWLKTVLKALPWNQSTWNDCRGFKTVHVVSGSLSSGCVFGVVEWDSIWTANKKIIDPIAPRHSAIIKEK